MPIFFIPLYAGIDLNGIAALIFVGVTLIYLNEALARAELVVFIIVPWIIILLIYLISGAFLGVRSSLFPFIAQCVFMLGAIGVGLSLSKLWFQDNGPEKIMKFSTAMSLSFFTLLIATAPLENLIGMVSNLTNPIAAVWHSRRAFSPYSFVGGVSAEDLSSFQNRIAQHMFTYGLFVCALSMIARQKLKSGWIEYSFNLISSAFMIIMSIILLSGQALGELLIVTLFCGASYLVYRTNYYFIISLIVIFIAFAISIPWVVNTDLYAEWFGRFSGGNISTGRTDRWAMYLRINDGFTFLGMDRPNTLDPHNFYIALLYESGPLAVCALLVFSLYMLIRPFIKLRRGVEIYGFPYLIMMSVGPQVVFVTMIGGGWGMPGLAEWFKVGLFIFGTQLTPGLKFIWPKKGPL
ncbi:hypothetical protein P775_05740 [Puniceibacterium antarcticum]|uniref:Uncharacterized protein n=1 Tax=Puniceibacterium antarcticum TaxID=1206336 RepID=A0A2G8RI66_9RHOB|nr:hypothetical protein P775_05740 [Puniceibacterium antarcticum]